MQWRSARVCTALIPVLVATLVASCSDNTSTGPRIATMTVVSGNDQNGAIGGLVALPLVVLVEDQRGDPVVDAVVTWEVTSGDGLVSPLVSTTGADGQAETTFRLGSAVGVQTVSASLAGSNPVSFTATAVAAPASRLTLVSGDGQSGKVGQVLIEGLSIRVADAFDNPKAGVPITFTVLTGGGSVNSASVTSDAEGLAAVQWTLGIQAGSQSLVAGAGSLVPVTFTATASPDAPVQILLVSGAGQTAAPGATLPDSIVVRVVDQYGNGVSGQTVNWILPANDGSVSPTSTLSDATGRAAVRWTIGEAGGPKVLTAQTGAISQQIDGAALVSFTTIVTGGRHTCALGIGGIPYCWGFNGDAELGIGTQPAGSGPVFAEPQPVATTGNWTFRDISAGMGHTCAVVLTGEAFCWGSNVDGRIGQESHTTERFSTPQQVHTTYTFTSVTSGRAHNCGIGFSTRPVCWGSNHEGETGVVGSGVITVDSSTIDRPAYVFTPVFQAGAVSIAAGGVHGCSVDAVGLAYCWGNNVFGQLGDGTNARQISPVQVTGAALYVSVTAGGYHTCALAASGAAQCWGLNTSGQLGNGGNGTSNTPVSVTGGLTFTRLSAGTSHTCGLTGAGAAFCWGLNAHGQLGNGSLTASNAPVAVGGGLVFRTISAGEAQTCGVTTANVAYCWGDNQFGALGDGTTTNRSLPAKVRFQP